jgi:hypothetical protein
VAARKSISGDKNRHFTEIESVRHRVMPMKPMPTMPILIIAVSPGIQKACGVFCFPCFPPFWTIFPGFATILCAIHCAKSGRPVFALDTWYLQRAGLESEHGTSVLEPLADCEAKATFNLSSGHNTFATFVLEVSSVVFNVPSCDSGRSASQSRVACLL